MELYEAKPTPLIFMLSDKLTAHTCLEASSKFLSTGKEGRETAHGRLQNVHRKHFYNRKTPRCFCLMLGLDLHGFDCFGLIW